MKPTARTVAGVLFVALAAGSARAADPKGTVVAGEVGRRLDEAVRTAAGEAFWGGVLVARGGEVLLAKGYGFADYEKRPNAPDTLFEIASASKQVTATAVLRLEQQGKLKTSDTLDRFFPGLPDDKKAVTVDHLLHHTAGLADDLGVSYAYPGSRAQYVPEVTKKPLAAPPGTRFSYSNVGYALLAAIVEEASGKTFEDYVKKELFGRAGMKDSGFVKDPVLQKTGRASARRSEKKEMDGTAVEWFWGWGYRGMGGVVTTLLDLHLWDRALRGDKVLGEPAKEKLHTAALEGYACGWKVETTERGTTKAHHSGGVAGYRSQVARFLEDDVFVAVLTNEKGDPFAVERAVGSVLFQPPKLEAEIDAEDLEMSASGAVEIGESAKWTALVKGGTLHFAARVKNRELFVLRLPPTYAKKLVSDLESATRGRPVAKKESSGGAFLGPYGKVRHLRLDEQLSLQVMPRYVGRGADGKEVVDERPALVLVDGKRQAWPVLVHLGSDAVTTLLGLLKK